MSDTAIHIKIKMEVFGKEYQATELTYAVASLELVKLLQAKLASSLLELNQTPGVTQLP